MASARGIRRADATQAFDKTMHNMTPNTLDACACLRAVNRQLWFPPASLQPVCHACLEPPARCTVNPRTLSIHQPNRISAVRIATETMDENQKWLGPIRGSNFQLLHGTPTQNALGVHTVRGPHPDHVRPRDRPRKCAYTRTCACAIVGVHARARARVCGRVCACVRTCVYPITRGQSHASRAYVHVSM